MKLDKDRTARVVVLKSSSVRAFCAGHDLREMVPADEVQLTALFRQCSDVMRHITRLPQPVIAQVQGVATAAGKLASPTMYRLDMRDNESFHDTEVSLVRPGCQLVATCDMAVASSTARFGVNGINLGLFCSTPMVPLSRCIGHKKAFELLTTGRMLSVCRHAQLVPPVILRYIPCCAILNQPRSSSFLFLLFLLLLSVPPAPFSISVCRSRIPLTIFIFLCF